MSLKKSPIEIEIQAYIWRCKCGSAFSVLNHYTGSENGEWAWWGNPERPPFCPSCGEQLPESDGVDR